MSGKNIKNENDTNMRCCPTIIEMNGMGLGTILEIWWELLTFYSIIYGCDKNMWTSCGDGSGWYIMHNKDVAEVVQI